MNRCTSSRSSGSSLASTPSFFATAALAIMVPLALTAALAVFAPAIGRAQQPSTAPDPVAITNIAVVDVASGEVAEPRTIVIREGRITRVAPSGTAVPDDAQAFDGRGMFVIPGLWDAHVHLSFATESALPALIANGVTTVRDWEATWTRSTGGARRSRRASASGRASCAPARF